MVVTVGSSKRLVRLKVDAGTELDSGVGELPIEEIPGLLESVTSVVTPADGSLVPRTVAGELTVGTALIGVLVPACTGV